MADDGSSNLSVGEMLAKARAGRLAWKREHAAKTAAEAAARRAEVDRMTARVSRAEPGGGAPGADGEAGPAVPEGGAWGIVFGASAAGAGSDDATVDEAVGEGAHADAVEIVGESVADEAPVAGDSERGGGGSDAGVLGLPACSPAPPNLLSMAVPAESTPNDPSRPESLDFGRVA